MIPLSELFKYFRILSDPGILSKQETEFLQKFLDDEYQKREQRKIQHLMRMSGIKRVKLLGDFDWKFNPRIPKDRLMEYMNTEWLKKPSNLILIGPAGVGKTHVATAFCHDALGKGRQTLFLSLFDLTAKMAKSKNVYSLIDYYAKVPVFCLDEVGYVIPSKEQADCIFQIISKRTEVGTTIVTTNLVPSQWGKVFDTVTASAILDRLSMNGKFITFDGRSYRGGK
ncbi:MAG TPA: ATP-binding protein [Dissulfurispiraceae bacterium]|nr:ATP-binding protein [Dissulfurispiraceae bacterium]